MMENEKTAPCVPTAIGTEQPLQKLNIFIIA